MLRLELVVCQPFSPVPHHLLPHPVDLLLHLQLLEHRTEQEEVNVGLSPAVLQVYGDRGPLLRGTVSRVGRHVVTHHSRLWAQSSVQVFPSLKLPHFTTTKIVNRRNVLYTD